MPLSFVSRLLGRERPEQVLQLFTPVAAREQSTGTKLALAGATFVGLAVSGVVALASLAVLFAALGAIYFLLTQVLGIRLDVDPQAFVERTQAYGRN